MYKVLAFIARRPGISAEEFRDYYEQNHVKLIKRLTPAMAAYRRNYINRAEPFLRCEDQIDFDVVTEMEFETRDDCQAWFDAFRDHEVLSQVFEDERKFVDQDRLRVCAVDIGDGQ